MWFLNIHLNKEKIIFICAIIALIVIILFYLSNGIIYCHDKIISKFRINNTDEERRNFMEHYGIKTTKKPFEKEIVIIPEKFDEVYINYEKMQNEMGLSLKEYKGKKIVKYTYEVENLTDERIIFANLFCCNGYVIACDVVCPDFVNGFITSFEKYKENFSIAE